MLPAALRFGANRIPLIVALLFLVVRPADAQDDRWEAHTSFRQANDVAVSGEALWVATRGGVYRYDPATGEKTRYSVSEGLHSTDVRAIAYEPGNRVVWMGYADGVFDRLDVESGAVRSFYDIQRNDRYPTRGINRLTPQGDSLYLATDFGIVVFDVRPDRLEIRDTYAQLGTTATVGIPVTEVIRFSRGGVPFIAASGSGGVSVGRADSPNLQDPASWTRVPTSSPALSIAYFRDRMYVGTENGLLAETDAGGFEPTSLGAADIRRMVTGDGRLFGVDRFLAFEVGGDGSIRRFGVTGHTSPRSLTIGPAGRLWIADVEGGLLGLPHPLPAASSVAAEFEATYPQGPYHGRFASVAVDADGNMWAGGTAEAGTGVYRLGTDGIWTSFIGRTESALEGRGGFVSITTDPSGGAWGGSRGNSVVRIGPDDDVAVFDHTNSALRGLVNDPGYIVVGGVGTDAAGTLWATNMFTQERLVARTADGEWHTATPLCEGFTPAGNFLERVFIDSYGNKWFIILSETNLRIRRGLLTFDSGASIGDGNDDQCRFFNSEGGLGQGLPSIAVNTVAEDRDGRIWIGTDAGPAYTQNSRLLPQSTGPVFIWPQPANRAQGNFLLFGIAIRDVAVDPSNRIWFATDNGVYAAQDAAGGGFDIVAHFTSENSPLLSDMVLNLAVDGRTGRVFFNTDRGLISYRGGGIEPAAVAGDLFIYPNPVRVEGDAAPAVNIRGLVDATELRILTAAGELIARMSTRGGEAVWDGRDLSGRLVRSGMYLVLAVGSNGEGRAVGKVAVVR